MWLSQLIFKIIFNFIDWFQLESVDQKETRHWVFTEFFWELWRCLIPLAAILLSNKKVTKKSFFSSTFLDWIVTTREWRSRTFTGFLPSFFLWRSESWKRVPWFGFLKKINGTNHRAKKNRKKERKRIPTTTTTTTTTSTTTTNVIDSAA